MFNHQNPIDNDSDDDDEIVNSNISDKIRCIITYVSAYLWCISFVFLIFIMYTSILGPLNIVNNFSTGKHSKWHHFY